MPRSTLTIILFNIFLACSWQVAMVSAAPLADGSSSQPIHIEADRMESDQNKEAVLFAGNVEATQEDLIIQADQMTVYYRKAAQTLASASNAAKSIEKLEATGNIKIIKKDWLASGDRMEFETRDRKVVITGNTKVWQGNNTVTGERVVLFLDEGKSIVENQSKGDGGRVKASFYPKPDDTKQNEK